MIKLRDVRKARGLTQAQLAEKVRKADPTVDQATISVLERGDLYPGEKLMEALCKALDCSQTDLYDGIEAFFVPSEEKKYSETTMHLAIILGTGGPVQRTALRNLMSIVLNRDISDRGLRKLIEIARKEGLVIANDQDGDGYYRPRTKAELEALYRQNEHRALSILSQQRHIRSQINACG